MAKKARNKKTKRTASKRRSGLRGVSKGAADFMAGLQTAAIQVAETTAGIMATDGIVENLLKKDGNYLLSPNTNGTKDNETGGALTGGLIALAGIIGLTQVNNSHAREMLKGAAAEGMKLAAVSKLPKLKDSLGLKGIGEAEYNADVDDEEKIDWEAIAREVQDETLNGPQDEPENDENFDDDLEDDDDNY